MSIDGEELHEHPDGTVLRLPRLERRASKRVRRAVAEAARDWESRSKEQGQIDDAIELGELRGDIRVALPRPPRIKTAQPGDDVLPRRDEEVFAVPITLLLGRIFVWMWAAIRFLAGNLWDVIRKKDSEERRAVRLRQTLQRAGTTFIKVGQQLSIRMDLVPYVYARELEKLLDDVPAFPLDEAIAIIERTTGKKIGDMYSAIDPKPIGSASVACVFQGVRLDGRRVAVKVRRPRVGVLISADMDALELVFNLLELWYLPPGFTAHFSRELRTMLLDEMNFTQEARFTDLFRRRARKAKINWLTAPHVHFDLSSREVLVTEFVPGVWVHDLLAAFENSDAAMTGIRAMDIDPKVVARRYLQANRFGGFENVFFHADLHPANVVIQPGNKLVLIDFGACGSFPKRELDVWRRLLDAQDMEDVGAMAQAALALIEPLPAIDIDEFQKRLEAVFWQDLYAIKDKHSQWWERTSANIWISFLKLAREYDVSMNLNTLRMIRATMLADTIAARLDPHIDQYAEFRKYERRAGVRARRRLHKVTKEVLSTRLFARVEQLVQNGLAGIFRLQRFVNGDPLLNFAAEVGKAAYAFKLVLDFVGKAIVWTFLWMASLGLLNTSSVDSPTPGLLSELGTLLTAVVKQPLYWLGLLIVGSLTARRLHQRLHNPETKSRQRLEI